MAERCTAPFDEALLSAYLDGELTQAESQPIRLHLEDCKSCRETVESMRTLREAALTTPFRTFDDEQWNERPRGPLSGPARWVGWGLVVASIAGAIFLAIRELEIQPGDWGEAAIGFGLLGGVVALLLSVLLDRLKSYPTDRYRRVQK